MAETSNTPAERSSQKPCKKCNNYAKSGLTCVKCGTVYHNGCLKYLKDVIINEDNTVLCCAVSDVLDHTMTNNGGHENISDISNSSFMSATEVLDIENLPNPKDLVIYYLKDLIKHKDFIINQLQEHINLLKNQIISSGATSRNTTINKNSATKSSETDSDISNKIATKPLVETITTHTQSIPTNSTFSTRSPAGIQNNTMNESSTVNKSKHFETTENKKQSGNSGKKKVIGTLPTDEQVSVSKKHWIFVSKYALSYTKKDLIEYLNLNFKDNNFIINELPVNDRYHFKSFKIGIDKQDREKLLSESVWPTGIEASDFEFFRNVRKKSPNRNPPQKRQQRRFFK